MKSYAVVLILFSSVLFSQEGFRLSKGTKTVIPFRLINNLIFIPFKVNGVELNFLLDSGVNETILFSLDDKEVNFNDVEKIKFSGLGETKNIEGLRSINNEVLIGDTYLDPKHTIFIILDESINFSSHVGIAVNGIIGYQFFRNYAVKIDYITQKITITSDENLLAKQRKRFEELPISIEGFKPYVTAGVEQRDQRVSSKMLLDLGNSDAVWLFPTLIEDFVYNRPNIYDYLGQGFNGDIYGKRSRIHRIYLGESTFEKPIAAMPDEYSIQNLKLVPERKGSVGSEILRRFTVIFDYPNSKFYFRRNRHYKDPFLFNKSGLDIQHDGMVWETDIVKVETQKNNPDSEKNTVYDAREGFRYNFVLKPRYSIAGCRKESPCEAAGLKKDDRIIRINGQKVSGMSLQRINNLLKSDDGTRVTFDIERGGEPLRVFIVLIDPIPYQE